MLSPRKERVTGGERTRRREKRGMKHGPVLRCSIGSSSISSSSIAGEDEAGAGERKRKEGGDMTGDDDAGERVTGTRAGAVSQRMINEFGV